ncbi:hypothetical protein AXG55_06005 [Silvanigrella aquatica]|uniref:Uncharacterized protein n=1 Tax=Silvanigrella aquatica TaxID=1915309 RepID=A0A1L4CZV4_9BACT|nr:hypothetical protein AXG55_06005 [Silvanigrella aquatica]
MIKKIIISCITLITMNSSFALTNINALHNHSENNYYDQNASIRAKNRAYLLDCRVTKGKDIVNLT